MKTIIFCILAIFFSVISSTATHELGHYIEYTTTGGNVTEICIAGHSEQAGSQAASGWVSSYGGVATDTNEKYIAIIVQSTATTLLLVIYGTKSPQETKVKA